MADSLIEWTSKVWNPVRGCALVSDGCRNCYAMKQAHRFSGPKRAYHGLTVLGNHGPKWTGEARFIPEKLADPLRWRKPEKIFVNSMSDLFHEDVTNEQIAAVFGVMAACYQHTFQILTKRPERMVRWFDWARTDAFPNKIGANVLAAWSQSELGDGSSEDETRQFDRLQQRIDAAYDSVDVPAWPLPNVWLGVSVENQKAADERIPLLHECPAAVHWVSAEPLLERTDLHTFLNLPKPMLDWVVCGGESGPGARPCAIEWLESIIEQCQRNSVPVFCKQMGSYVVSEHRKADSIAEAEDLRGRKCTDEDLWLWRAGLTDAKGADVDQWPHALRVREFPREESPF